MKELVRVVWKSHGHKQAIKSSPKKARTTVPRRNTYSVADQTYTYSNQN